MKQLLTALLLIFAMSQVSYAERSFTCKEELAVGFEKVNGTWKALSFRKETYTVQFNDAYTRFRGDCISCAEEDTRKQLFYFSHTIPFTCDRFMGGFLGPSSKDFAITCEKDDGALNWGANFIFDRETHRFVFVAPSLFEGYVSGSRHLERGPSTDNMSAGTCKETF